MGAGGRGGDCRQDSFVGCAGIKRGRFRRRQCAAVLRGQTYVGPALDCGAGVSDVARRRAASGKRDRAPHVVRPGERGDGGGSRDTLGAEGVPWWRLSVFMPLTNMAQARFTERDRECWRRWTVRSSFRN